MSDGLRKDILQGKPTYTSERFSFHFSLVMLSWVAWPSQFGKIWHCKTCKSPSTPPASKPAWCASCVLVYWDFQYCDFRPDILIIDFLIQIIRLLCTGSRKWTAVPPLPRLLAVSPYAPLHLQPHSLLFPPSRLNFEPTYFALCWPHPLQWLPPQFNYLLLMVLPCGIHLPSSNLETWSIVTSVDSYMIHATVRQMANVLRPGTRILMTSSEISSTIVRISL